MKFSRDPRQNRDQSRDPREQRDRRLDMRDTYHNFEEERARDRMTYAGREAPDYEQGRHPNEMSEPFAGPPPYPAGPSFTSQFYGPFADNDAENAPKAPPGPRKSNGNRWDGDRQTTQTRPTNPQNPQQNPSGTPSGPGQRPNRANYSQPAKFPNDNAMHSGSYGYDEHAYDQLDEDMSSTDSRTTYSRQFLGPYGGVGPKGYKRSDERVHEAVAEMLMRDTHIDASNIEVTVKDGAVTLTGSVPERKMKFHAEDLAERCFGVRDITNQLRVVRDGSTTEQH